MLNALFDSDNNNHKSFELPGAHPHYNPDRPGQVEHIFLDLVLNIPEKSFSGVCTITLNPLRSGINKLTFDAVNLNIQSVEIDGIQQHFDYDGEQLQIWLKTSTKTAKNIPIAITYSVENPQRGLYFIAPDQYYPQKPTQVWTQGEDEDSRFWFPCFDYPGQLSTSEIRVKVPKPFIAISNGELINSEEEENTKIYHWLQQQVHPTYLMTLAVGDFAEIQDEWQIGSPDEGQSGSPDEGQSGSPEDGQSGRQEDGQSGRQDAYLAKKVPVTYYVEKGREEDAKRSMGKTPRMIEFFSKKFGYVYPYPKYAQVCVDDFIFGGMENTSTTLLTDRCLQDERALLDRGFTESLVAHELAHQWFGDLLVIKHWSHAWIKEGMASYSEVFWTAHEFGNDDAAYYILNEARSYLNEDSSRYRRPIVTHVYREAIELYDRHLYEKGACVYHMIRSELGDELFWKAVHTFVQDNAHKTVETIDLLRSIDKATGRNLLFLFDQYVYRGGHPDYKVAYTWDADSNLAKVTVTQTQVKEDKNGSSKDLFDLKIPIGFGWKTSELKSFTVRVNEREQSFYFPLSEKPDYLSFDVGNYILKTVLLEYPIPELKAQLELDSDPTSRIYAAEALAKKGGLEAVKALTNTLQNDPFWGVRLEAAKQLAEVKLDQSFNGLVTGLQDQDARVRRAVVEGLGSIKTLESYAILKSLLQRGDASYNVEATAARVLGGMVKIKPNDTEFTEEIIALLLMVLKERQGWNEVVRGGAIAGLSQLKNSDHAAQIISDYTRLGVPQSLRLAAIRALGTIFSGQVQNNQQWILEQLAELTKETFFLTQVAVVSALGQTDTVKAISILQSLADQTPDGRVRRNAEEAIQKVQKNVGADQAVKQLREEFDQLKKENQELKSRLENLEAKSK